jgi:hypothetical protein
MLFLAEGFTSHRFDEFAHLIAFFFRVTAGLTTPIFLLFAAWFLLRCPSKWPAYFIGASAFYFASAHSIYLMMDPMVQRIFGTSMSSQSYMQLLPVLAVCSWFVSIVNGVAILTVCRRLAAASRPAEP